MKEFLFSLLFAFITFLHSISCQVNNEKTWLNISIIHADQWNNQLAEYTGNQHFITINLHWLNKIITYLINEFLGLPMFTAFKTSSIT